MKYTEQTRVSTAPLGNVSERYLADEAELLRELAELADSGPARRAKIQETAAELVRGVRNNTAKDGGLDAFMQQFDLSSQEGVLLMCVAEALLRIPDSGTADRLIADKLTSASWKDHLGASDSLFVNASTWGLMLTGQMLSVDSATAKNPAKLLAKMVGKAGEPVVRTAMRQAMRIIGHQFVMGRTIDEALRRAADKDNRHFLQSYDMLGEAALTSEDAARYFEAYEQAIVAISESAGNVDSVFEAPSISIKLSALHPRYDAHSHRRIRNELAPRVLSLAERAAQGGIGLTIDAEEVFRLEPSLHVFEELRRSPSLDGYHGLGLAVQAYQRRATGVIDFVIEIATETGARIPVRLVKGAYWDAEVKTAQEQGLDSYPVFTRKQHTDVSYIACARKLLAADATIYPQFATHNAHTIATIVHTAGSRRDYEFQRLHGMGEELYELIVDPEKYDRKCRIYAPVGSHEDLLPYLVRRLLENGANSSFVNRILDEHIPIDDIVRDPIALSHAQGFSPHPMIPPPSNLFGTERINSRGMNIDDRRVLRQLLNDLESAAGHSYQAMPITTRDIEDAASRQAQNPADADDHIGSVQDSDLAQVRAAVAAAAAEWRLWDATPVANRATILERAADLIEHETPMFVDLCVREAGKTIPDALSEIREAVDFLRYYAAQARHLFAEPTQLKGPTGERNCLGFRGRGVFVCISPWNFPLAIFLGQVAAALAAGNAVVAKPAEQTPVIAYQATRLLHQAGVPNSALQLVLGGGEVGATAIDSDSVAGVAFTGSTRTAKAIQRSLAGRDGAIPVFVAETGGLNAMFVDSSALPEQVVSDVLTSAFNSAGQRCSALRLLCIQQDVADRVIELLAGAMQELRLGDPRDVSTDVGPVIDSEAAGRIEQHVAQLRASARPIFELPVSDSANGTFIGPSAWELTSLDDLTEEVFGPVLHVYRYRAKDMAKVLDAVNDKGYGLTMGLHSRITSRAETFAKLSQAGNIYINRNMVGAVVGVQPFGGRGLSGTGPKAGGPNYLPRFGAEYTVSDNISAVGGNASLLSLSDRLEDSSD